MCLQFCLNRLDEPPAGPMAAGLMTTETNDNRRKRPGNSTDRTLQQIRDAIQNGQFAPGQRLIEADLMEAFSVTRGPLREALRRLGMEGTVELVPNRGAIVKAFSRSELIDLFRIRESVEGLAARLAAEEVAKKGVREAFVRDYEAIDARGADPATVFREENGAFHDLILRFADNAQLTLLMKRLQLPVIRFQVRATLDEVYRQESRTEHRAVFDAIVREDPDAAEACMRTHLRNAAHRIFERSPTTRG
ncbi:FCD domain-containing protein [Bordetella petrii]|nr:FCD domain-containing protein [Bordetella petrii]